MPLDAVHPETHESSPQAERTLQSWQRRLLPFMMASLIAMGVFFFVATLWLFIDLETRLEHKHTDIVQVLDKLERVPVSQEGRAYREWYVRAVLEKSALEQRFNMQAAVVKGRLWTRFMGFLTGMILALSGCVFVLGKLREPVQAAAEGGGFKANLATSSPGIFLAFAGAVLIGIALTAPTTVESSDASIYLPRQVQLVDAEGQVMAEPVEKPRPPAVAPAPQPGGEKGLPPLPRSVVEEIGSPVAGARKN